MILRDRTRQLLWGVATYGVALGIAFAVTTATILALGRDPVLAYRAALNDSLGSLGGLGQTLNRMTPLLLASLTFSLGMHAGLFNVGMDGQIYAGAILATGVGLWLGEGASPWVALPAVLVAGMVGGLLWAVPPALLRVRWGVNEIFSTVMLNFVALFLVEYLATGPWNDPTAGEAITYPVPRAATLPQLLPRGGAHTGVLLACGAGVVLWWFLFRTVPGYEIRATGSNARAAQVAGIRLGAMYVLALVLGGAISGLAGAIEVSGVHERLLLRLSPDYGIMAILVAVLGRYHPVVLIPVNFAFAVLIAGSDSLQRTVGFPSAAVFLVQAIVVLIVLGAHALRQRRERFVI